MGDRKGHHEAQRATCAGGVQHEQFYSIVTKDSRKLFTIFNGFLNMEIGNGIPADT